MGIPDVVVVSGEGRYADPWHDFPGTSARIAQILTEHGLRVEVHGTSTAPVVAELYVVNAGGGADAIPAAAPDDPSEVWRGCVLDHVLAGGPVLAAHAATNTFFDDESWAAAVGGRWVPGASMHPPGGPATIQVRSGHAITEGLPAELDIVDERYSFLETSEHIVPLLTHVHDDVVHPIAWAFTGPVPGWDDPVRVVVDTLGHDVAAYGDVRADLLRREIDWLLPR